MKEKKLLVKPSVKIGLSLSRDCLSSLEAKVSADSPPEIFFLDYQALPLIKEDKDVNILSNILNNIAKLSKLKTKNVYLALDSSFLERAEIKLPRVSEEELVKGIRWQAEKYIKIPIDEATIDFQLISEDVESDSLNVVIVACRKSLIRNLVFIFKESGLQLQLVDAAPFCIAKSISDLYARDNVIAGINLGQKNSSVIVVKSGVLKFLRSIEMGSDNLFSSISNEKNVDVNKAKEFINSIADLTNLQDGQLKVALSKFVSEFSRQVYRSVFYYNEQNPDAKIVEIVVCGELADKLGFPVELLKVTGLKSSVANPIEHFQLSEDLKNKFSPLGSLFMSPYGAIL